MDQSEKKPPARPFMDTLRLMAGGRVLHIATEKQQQVVHAVRQLGAKGELTIKLAYRMDGEQVRVDAKVDAKIPTPSAGAGLFFINEEGALVPDDPRQESLFARRKHEVDPETGEILDYHPGA